MTPSQVAAKLQHFNDWRRGHHDDTAQPDPCEIGEAIDAAVEMIARLEAAEKDIALKEKIIDALGSALNAVAKERDTLHTALEKIADWDSAWGPYPETNEAWRAMAVVTAREAVPRQGEKE